MPETSIFKLFIIFAWAVAALWAAAFGRTWFCLRRQPRLRLNKKTGTNSGSFVSVIVPARNEARRVLEKSISSMLAQNYPNFELIVLNDRSTDATGEILEKLKTRHPEAAFRIIDGVEPAAGWLGKPHALEQAFRQTTRGEWILTTDADIIFAPETLSTVVARAEALPADALTLLPRQTFGSFWERLFMPVFGWFNLLKMPLHRVNDPRRPESMGVGNFFMIRRSLLTEIGGFACVRNEVAEDLKLAAIIKSRGSVLRIESAPELLETRMYQGFQDIWQGFTKNFFPGMNYSVLKTVSGALAILLFGVLPLFFAMAALLFGQTALFAPFFIAYLGQIAVFVITRLDLRENPLYALLTPLGLLIFMLILINSMLKILTGKGVKWKGRAIYEQGGVRPPQGQQSRKSGKSSQSGKSRKDSCQTN